MPPDYQRLPPNKNSGVHKCNTWDPEWQNVESSDDSSSESCPAPEHDTAVSLAATRRRTRSIEPSSSSSSSMLIFDRIESQENIVDDDSQRCLSNWARRWLWLSYVALLCVTFLRDPSEGRVPAVLQSNSNNNNNNEDTPEASAVRLPTFEANAQSLGTAGGTLHYASGSRMAPVYYYQRPELADFYRQDALQQPHHFLREKYVNIAVLSCVTIWALAQWWMRRRARKPATSNL